MTNLELLKQLENELGNVNATKSAHVHIQEIINRARAVVSEENEKKGGKK